MFFPKPSAPCAFASVRQDVARYDGGWSIESCFQEEEHPCDAVLMAKELSCSDCLAQVPLVIMPYRLMERLIAKPMKQSARLQLSADKIKECNPESVCGHVSFRL